MSNDFVPDEIVDETTKKPVEEPVVASADSYDFKRIAIAVFAGLAVGLGVFFEAIPLDFIVGLFKVAPQ